ncbi:hypothetical protein MMC31_005529 [Peltigera leucophlebia]|nr:hypothetical protein [Peltigera leucophlebia]
MALSYESIFASATFRFLVGSNKRLFTVHVAPIAHHSKSLGDLMNGGMSEAHEGCASLEDVEESTFIRFSQYAYTGDYFAADPEILLDSSTIACASTPSRPTPSNDDSRPEAVAVEESAYSGFSIPVVGPPVGEKEADVPDLWLPFEEKKKGRTKGPAESKSQEESFNFDDDHSTGESASSSRRRKLCELFQRSSTFFSKVSFYPRINQGSCEDYTDVFICHAQLYVFADKWDIAPLKRLCLYKLQQTLIFFTLYKERVGDIVALMRYSYDNTPHLSATDEPLRSLVIHYATCVVEALVQTSEFKALLLAEEGRQLASDLIVRMIDRLD